MILAAHAQPVAPNATFMERIRAQQAAQAACWPYLIPVMALGLLIVPATYAAVTNVLATAYLGRSITAGTALRKGIAVMLPVIGTFVLWYLALVFGLMACLVPGIVFSIWWMHWHQVVVLERTWGVAALMRSYALMRGSIGTGFVLGLLLFVLMAGLGMSGLVITNPVAQGAFNILLGNATMGISTAAYVVFYVSCRCKTENFDLQLRADSLDEKTAGGTLDVEASAS